MYQIFYRHSGNLYDLCMSDTQAADRGFMERQLKDYRRRYTAAQGYEWFLEERGGPISKLRDAQHAYGEIEAYLRPDWLDQDWFQPYAAVHYPRFNPDGDALMVEFYESEAKRDAGRLTSMRLGRYLRRFAKKDGAVVLKDEEIERVVAEADVRLRQIEVKITQDADEIEEVYTHGPSSCMSHRASHYSGSCHPSRVYAGPDLGVAYLGDSDDATARAIVWPDRKIYGGVYGDVSRMRRALAKLGYTNDCDFDGARLQLIEDGSRIVLPYLDIADEAGIEDGYVVLGSGDLETDSTSGTVYYGGSARCDRCEERMPADESYSIEVAEDEYEDWCYGCYDYHTSRCDHSDNAVCDSEVVEVQGPHGYSVNVARWNLSAYGAVEVDGEWVHEDLTASHPLTGERIMADDLDEILAEIEAGRDTATLPMPTQDELEAAGQMRLELPAVEPSRDDPNGWQVENTRNRVACNHYRSSRGDGYYIGTYADCERVMASLSAQWGDHYRIVPFDPANPLPLPGHASRCRSGLYDLALAA